MGCCVIESLSQKGGEKTEKKQNGVKSQRGQPQLPSKWIAENNRKNNKSNFSSTVSAEENISTLEDMLLDQENMQLQQWKRQHSTAQSVILKRPRKKQRDPQRPKEESQAINSIVSELRSSENIDCTIIQEKGGQKLSFGNNITTIEFLLPRSRGGPLVVPFLLYQNYSPY